MDSFPAFVPLKGARVVVVGEGDAADAKARLFEGSPAELVRLDEAAALAPDALAGARLVFIAAEPATCRRIARAAHAAGALVNAVDLFNADGDLGGTIADGGGLGVTPSGSAVCGRSGGAPAGAQGQSQDGRAGHECRCERAAR